MTTTLALLRHGDDDIGVATTRHRHSDDDTQQNFHLGKQKQRQDVKPRNYVGSDIKLLMPTASLTVNHTFQFFKHEHGADISSRQKSLFKFNQWAKITFRHKNVKINISHFVRLVFSNIFNEDYLLTIHLRMDTVFDEKCCLNPLQRLKNWIHKKY